MINKGINNPAKKTTIPITNIMPKGRSINEGTPKYPHILKAFTKLIANNPPTIQKTDFRDVFFKIAKECSLNLDFFELKICRQVSFIINLVTSVNFNLDFTLSKPK